MAASPVSETRAVAPAPATAPTPVPTVLRWSLHVLVAGLLVLSALRPAGHGSSAAATVGAAVLVGAVYAVGPRWPAVSRSRGAAGLWLTLLVASWLVLLALTPAAIYLAFAWSFLLLHLLPRPAGLAAVAFTTVAAIAGFAWHQDAFTPAMAIGPVLGAAVVTATVWGYQTLQAESERRRRLIVELERTRAELATAERQTGVLAERERLAREIHDTLAQGLSSIQLLLRAAGRSLEPERAPDPPRAAALVEQARQTAQDNLAEARRFVRALAPGDLQGSSLSPALQRLCEATSGRSGMPVTFRHEGPDVALPTPVEVALLRIAQSALGNVTQHSGAARADVTLTVMDTAVTLDVVDDGGGFDAAAVGQRDPARTPQGGGFGLTSMRSRAAELGGLLTVESQPGGGTAVSVHLDLARVAGGPR